MGDLPAAGQREERRERVGRLFLRASERAARCSRISDPGREATCG